ncbi:MULTISPECIES: HTH domain-containing protein [Streptosporangiaceae]|uniref:HTH domain-containing protein n=1 Tax=Streptosporangiaceae TaxID=2004 RepID=UPI00340CA15A
MEERLRVYRQLRQRKDLTQQGIAMRMGVSRRAVQQYARQVRQEDGITLQRGVRTEPRAKKTPEEKAPRSTELRPLLLDHLRRFPQMELSSWELARIVDPAPRGFRGYPAHTVERALDQLIAEHLVELVVGVRDPDCDRRPVRRYRLARKQAEVAAEAITGEDLERAA